MQAELLQDDMEANKTQTRRFFDLPRELRDEIYKYCYQLHPYTSGALHGYADVPSSALLRTSKQVYQEALPIFRRGLEAVLLHDRVRFKFSSDSKDFVRHAGWHRVSHERFDIWVRKGPEADTEVGWLVYLSHIWQGGVQDAVLESSADEAFILRVRLKDLFTLFLVQKCEYFSPIGSRLHSLQSRVHEVVKKVESKEAARKLNVRIDAGRKELKESQSQPSGLGTQQEESLVHDWRHYGAVPEPHLRAYTGTGYAEQL